MHLNFTDHQRVRYSRIIICLSLLCFILLSFKLWLNERHYPLAPVFDFIPHLPTPIDWIQPALLVLLLGIIAIYRSPSVFITIFFILFWLLVAGDQNRLQPHCYIFVFMLLVVKGFKISNGEDEKFVLNSLRIILIGMYLWTGIHMLNMHFVDRFYPFIAGSKFTMPGFEPQDFLRKYVILIIPFTEISIAIGLMLNRPRRLALHLVILMHIAVIIFLSPFGYGWNLVAIPGHIAFILLNILLFWKVENIPLAELWNPKKSLVKVLVILLFTIMPFFNFIGKWEHNLSFSLSSFRILYGKVYIDEPIMINMPEYLKNYFYRDYRGEFIETTHWAMGELHVMPYPAPRVYEAVKESICAYDKRDSCRAVLKLYR